MRQHNFWICSRKHAGLPWQLSPLIADVLNTLQWSPWLRLWSMLIAVDHLSIVFGTLQTRRIFTNPFFAETWQKIRTSFKAFPYHHGGVIFPWHPSWSHGRINEELCGESSPTFKAFGRHRHRYLQLLGDDLLHGHGVLSVKRWLLETR